MHILRRVFSILAAINICCSLALPPAPVSNPAPLLPVGVNAFPKHATYVVPKTNIMVKVTRLPGFARQIRPTTVAQLIATAKAALDLLAQMYGGDHAELPDNMPRIRWAISGLAIQINDATHTSPTRAGGRLRFDEVMAAYTGLLSAEGKIGHVECTFAIWRVSSHLRREVKFLGWGEIRHALLDKMPPGANATVAIA
ncbi:MAG: hypothetical protein Q9207_007615 [Kuettlingeria erythrocarpa]